jgi:hypothetical protein
VSETSDSLLSKAFWLATLQRCVRVFAAALLAMITSSKIADVIHVDWQGILATAAMAPVVTLLLCVVGDTVTGGAGPAFGTVEVTSPPATPADGSDLKGGVVVGRHAGEAGVSNLLYTLGVVLVALAVILLVTTLLKVLVVSWVAVIVLGVVGIGLLVFAGRGTRSGVV